MHQSVALAGGRVFGREPEVAALERFFAGRDGAVSLVLTGGAGVGKTTLWEEGCNVARLQGSRVLAARPSDSETGLSFAALADLFHEIEVRALAGIPAPQLHALEVVLLLAEAARAPPEQFAISAGFLQALRALADAGPLVVAVDDVQWLDRPSGDVLAFAARRLHGSSIRFLLAARRPGQPTGLEQALAPGLERLEVGPLSLGAVRHLLSERLGLSLPRHVLRRLVDSTLGNPLFALEMGRVLAEHGLPRVGEALPVPDAVEDLLGERVASLSPLRRRLLLAFALSANLRTADLAGFADAATIEAAVDDGLVIVDGDRVRVSHPLLAAAARKRSRPRERRELHLELAGMVADEEMRARHLALAAGVPDEGLATTVGAAAASAFARGARQEAAELAEHALRLTPPESRRRGDRVLALAEYLETAGELQRVTDLLTPEFPALPRGSARARAWLILAEGGHIRTVDDYRRHLEQALAEAEHDPALRARVVAKKSSAVIGVERIHEAEVEALDVLPVARRAGPDVERLVLLALAWARALSGRPIDDVCERFEAASPVPAHLTESPDRVAGQRLLWRGELGEARVIFTRLLATADERGEAGSYAVQRLHLCELALRAGEWEEASRLLDEWAESADRDFLLPPMYERCRALLAAGRGLAAEAERWAAEAIARAEAMGLQFDWLEALRARGIAALLEHDPVRAIENLRAVWDHTEREGVDEPGAFPAAPDLVEALVAVREQEQAKHVTDRLRRLAEEQQHPWGLATATRCAGLIRLAVAGYDEQEAGLLQAADDYDRLGLRFDRARTLMLLGRAARRLKKWAAARDALAQAVAAFDKMGSPGWADQARAELSRVGARKPRAAGGLTPTEERVASLAADGLSNKEIAAALFVTVHTVEAHLSHAYAKLGVHSRGQLTRRLAQR